MWTRNKVTHQGGNTGVFHQGKKLAGDLGRLVKTSPAPPLYISIHEQHLGICGVDKIEQGKE